MIKHVLSAVFIIATFTVYGHMLYLTYHMASFFTAFAGIGEIGSFLIPKLFILFMLMMVPFGRLLIMVLLEDVKTLFGSNSNSDFSMQHTENPRATKTD